jgi:hypothetical protein
MRCHKRQRVCLRPLNQHTSIGHGARHTSGISGSSSHRLGQAFCFRLANLANLIKLFHLELHDTEQIELQNHNGALFVLYRTIYARHRLRNLVGARQNVLYSINFLGTGGLADVIAGSLSQMGRDLSSLVG